MKLEKKSNWIFNIGAVGARVAVGFNVHAWSLQITECLHSSNVFSKSEATMDSKSCPSVTRAYTVIYRNNNGPLLRAVLDCHDFPHATSIQSMAPYGRKEKDIPYAIHGKNPNTNKYLVQWLFYPNPKDWTWEPEENMGNYKHLVVRHDIAADKVKKEVAKTRPRKKKKNKKSNARPQNANEIYLRRSKRLRTQCV